MRTASRLGAYGLGVVVVFGLAAAAGAGVGPLDVGAASSHTARSDHSDVSASTVDEIDGYRVTLSGRPVVGSSTIEFDITRDGEPIPQDPHVDATGYLVVIRTGDLGYLHLHPLDGTDSAVRFAAEFPTPGTYRLFFDFAHDGEVHTPSFTVEVPTP